MLFNSLAYLVFLPVVFSLYWLVSKEYRWLVVLVASYCFYMFSVPAYGLIILGITIVSYVSAMMIDKTPDKRKRKSILIASIVVCIGTLIFFKYMGFVGNTVNSFASVLGMETDLLSIKIILPVGISFYTFQTMSYVIDVYRGLVASEKHFGKFAAFIAFFPQLVAGPIERTSNLLPQIKYPPEFSYDKAISGVKLMIWGYYKKLMIADFLSPYVQKVYGGPYTYDGFALVVATIFFAIQIYCDFSGYSDIAIGTAKLFGIDLMTNFRSPYFSKSVREFWSRWHISLSTWFRDYVYIPLGGNRVSRTRHCINLMVTFLVSGLWHGADWSFVLWGAIHGAAQVIETGFHNRKEKPTGKIVTVIKVLLVFIFTTFAWIFFVANSIEDAIYVITHQFNGISLPVSYLTNGFTTLGLVSVYDIVIIGIGLTILFIYDRLSVREDLIKRIGHRFPVSQWLFYLILGMIIVLFSQKGVPAEFIYFQF
ncbi:D-alanyl-lipoteichoic acid acyltransferase DltB, MBOAT superfamily [Ruminococcaceae bacterium YRB3002]|nr:D-alanyl-lipoteichoic acid acyltransferase DltB, MBOAT superfamily [Ruminococcaceae bacterium YRB3002]